MINDQQDDGVKRKVWGFPCSPDIPARMKMLADELQVPLYALTEHALQLSAGLMARMSEQKEERELLRQHIIEEHVGRRTIEKISQVDQDMANVLERERRARFRFERAIRAIVSKYFRAGLSPSEIDWAIDYAMRCRIAIARGQPVPTDMPHDDDD